MINALISLLTLAAIITAIYYMIKYSPTTSYVMYGVVGVGFLFVLFFTEIGKNFMSMMKSLVKLG